MYALFTGRACPGKYVAALKGCWLVSRRRIQQVSE